VELTTNSRYHVEPTRGGRSAQEEDDHESGQHPCHESCAGPDDDADEQHAAEASNGFCREASRHTSPASTFDAQEGKSARAAVRPNSNSDAGASGCASRRARRTPLATRDRLRRASDSTYVALELQLDLGEQNVSAPRQRDDVEILATTAAWISASRSQLTHLVLDLPRRPGHRDDQRPLEARRLIAIDSDRGPAEAGTKRCYTHDFLTHGRPFATAALRRQCRWTRAERLTADGRHFASRCLGRSGDTGRLSCVQETQDMAWSVNGPATPQWCRTDGSSSLSQRDDVGGERCKDR